MSFENVFIFINLWSYRCNLYLYHIIDILKSSFFGLCIWVVGGTQFLFAQRFHFQNYGATDGLPQSQVMDIIQSKGGYLWLATNGGGISRFDGCHFKNFGEGEGLYGIITQDIYEDQAGRIWVGTYKNGVCYYDKKGFTRLTTEEGLASNQVNAIVQDYMGRMWIGTERGINMITNDGTVKTFTTNDGLNSLRIQGLLIDSSGTLWAAMDKGLAKFDGESFQSYPMGNKGNAWSVSLGKDGTTIMDRSFSEWLSKV